MHLLQVANQSGLSSCPLPSADAGPVSSYTYMKSGLGVGIGKALWKARVDGGGHFARWYEGYWVSGVKLDTTLRSWSSSDQNGLAGSSCSMPVILTRALRVLTNSAVTRQPRQSRQAFLRLRDSCGETTLHFGDSCEYSKLLIFLWRMTRTFWEILVERD